MPSIGATCGGIRVWSLYAPNGRTPDSAHYAYKLAWVAAALVGTFLGILLSYGLVNPIASALESRLRAEHDYMSCIRTALLAFARGDSPMTCVEFARRNIEPVERPTFAELEALTRKAA